MYGLDKRFLTEMVNESIAVVMPGYRFSEGFIERVLSDADSAWESVMFLLDTDLADDLYKRGEYSAAANELLNYSNNSEVFDALAILMVQNIVYFAENGTTPKILRFERKVQEKPMTQEEMRKLFN